MTILKTACIALGLAVAAPLAMAAPLTFTVDGVEARGGTLYIGVQTEAEFMKDAGIDGSAIKAPAAGTHSATFDLPVGEYSVSVWHDANDDNVFDMSENGMPAEGWTMHNAKALRGMPTFDLVKISVTETGASVTETIEYPE